MSWDERTIAMKNTAAVLQYKLGVDDYSLKIRSRYRCRKKTPLNYVLSVTAAIISANKFLRIEATVIDDSLPALLVFAALPDLQL